MKVATKQNWKEKMCSWHMYTIAMGKEYLSFNEKTAIERFKYLFKIIHSKKSLLAHPLSILLIFPKKLNLQ